MGLQERDYYRRSAPRIHTRIATAGRDSTASPWGDLAVRLVAVALFFGLCVIAGHIWWGW